MLQTAVDNAWAADIILCAASGNYYSATEPPSGGAIGVNYPAAYANVLAVGATDQTDLRKRPTSADGQHWGAYYGPELDVCAPGVLLWSTDPTGTNGWNYDSGGPITFQGVSYGSCGDPSGDYFALMGGTSGATPHVAGLAALLRSQYPTLTNIAIRDIIERTCDKVNAGTYPYAYTSGRSNGTWHQQVGYGRINAGAALHYADVMIADHELDGGEVPSSTLVGSSWSPLPFWLYQPYVTTTDQPSAMPSADEPAAPNHDNYVHALVKNRGPATANDVNVAWYAVDYPATELHWPADFSSANLIAVLPAPIASIAPGASVPVQALWPRARVNVVAGFGHPCLLVQATCAQDTGGQVGDVVYDYNNIAQHNISFAVAGELIREFVLPFAVGHRESAARAATLLLDASAVPRARVLLDCAPASDLPYVDRILAAARDQRPHSCRVIALQPTALLIDCELEKREIKLEPGDEVPLPGSERFPYVDPERLRVTGAEPVNGDHSRLQLLDTTATIELPLEEGQVAPFAIRLELPEDTRGGEHFVVNVTQVSRQIVTGGISLIASV
jgi:hypothetical protein